MIITISDMWKNQQKMLDNDNQIKLSSLIGFLGERLLATGSRGARIEALARSGRATPRGQQGGGSKSPYRTLLRSLNP